MLRRKPPLLLLWYRLRNHRAYVNTPIGITYAGWFRYTVWDETQSSEVGTCFFLRRAQAMAKSYCEWLAVLDDRLP